MRAIGMAERALELMCTRALTRTTFGIPLSQRANIQDWIAEARIEIEMVRLLTLKAAHMMDTVGNKQARTEIAAIKVAAPRIASTVRSKSMAVPVLPTTSRSLWLTPIYAHFGSPMDPIRFTFAPSQRVN
jgi:acyl-CoA dehydrogenase